MAAWIVVYCRRPLGTLDRERLDAIARRPDYLTWGEIYGLDEAAVAAATDGLAFQRVTPGGFDVVYAGARRPIVVTRARDAEGVRAALADLAEVAGDEAAQALRERLGAVAEVVSFELGLTQFEDVGGVIADLIAYELAELGDGLVNFDHDEVYAWDERAAPVWRRTAVAPTGPER